MEKSFFPTTRSCPLFLAGLIRVPFRLHILPLPPPPPPHFCRAFPPTRSLIEAMAEAGHRRLWLDRYQEYTRTALTWVNRR